MRAVILISLLSLVSAANLSSKDKSQKVPFQEMAARMRDAFNCGVVVEKHLHGTLVGKDDEYQQMRQENNCDYVESVLNKLPDEH